MGDWTVLGLKDSKKWIELVNNCAESDIHFRPELLKLFEEKMGGKAMLFVSEQRENKNYILYPFFLRKINDLKQFSNLSAEYFDIVSPWYYGGIITNNMNNLDMNIKKFLSDFHEFANEQNIISEFTKIHPTILASKNYANNVDSIYQYDATYINLKQSVDEIWKQVKKSPKWEIKNARKNEINITFGKNDEGLKSFFKLYKKSMNRLKAEEFYNFSYDFIKLIKNNLKDNFILATAWKNSEPLGHAIFLFQYGICYYWLSAFDFESRKDHPNHLLLYEAILWAKKNEMNLFYFGGGKDKGLRKFKESFGGKVTKLFAIKKIYNKEIYNYLNKFSNNKVKTDYFPNYRK